MDTAAGGGGCGGRSSIGASTSGSAAPSSHVVEPAGDCALQSGARPAVSGKASPEAAVYVWSFCAPPSLGKLSGRSNTPSLHELTLLSPPLVLAGLLALTGGGCTAVLPTTPAPPPPDKSHAVRAHTCSADATKTHTPLPQRASHVMHVRTHTRTHARTHARARAHTHTQAATHQQRAQSRASVILPL